MRRIVVLLLVLLAIFSATAVNAEQTRYVGSKTEFVVSLLPYEDALLYYTSAGQLNAFRPHDKSEYGLTFELDGKSCKQTPAFSALFLGPEQRLYGAVKQDDAYRIYRALTGGSSIAMESIGDMTLPWDEKHFDDIMACTEGIVVTYGNDLFCWNPATGATSLWQNCSFEKVVSDGSRLLAYRPGAAGRTELVELHPVTQRVSTLYEVEDKPWLMAASPDGRWIGTLPQSGSIATARCDGAKDRMGYISKQSDLGFLPCCLTNTGVFAFAEGGMIYYEQLSANFDPDNFGIVVARFAGDLPGTQEFRLAYPDLHVLTREVGGAAEYNPAVAAEWIRSGDHITDLFTVGTANIGFEAMLQKGYCTDLSGDEELSALIRAMPECLTSCVMEDGKILGVPLGGAFMNSFLGVDPAVLEGIGYTLADIPGNVDELLDLLIAWMEDGTLDDIRLDDAGRNAPGAFAETFVQRFWPMYKSAEEKYVSFADPDFRRLMEKADRLTQLNRQRPYPGNDAPVLFPYTYRFFSVNSGFPENVELLPLTPFPGDAPRHFVRMDVLVLNPRSRHSGDALTYLKFLLQNMRPEARMFFWPDAAEPIEMPNYAEMRLDAEEQLAAWQTVADSETAAPKERLTAQEEVEAARRNLAFLDAHRWLVTEKHIADYRAHLDEIVVYSNDYLTAVQENMQSAIQRYNDGQLPVDKLVDAYIQLSRTIAMEDGVLLP